MIHQLVQRDETTDMISAHYKRKLLEMTNVQLDKKSTRI